jgi:hypothetical protein
MDAVATCQLDQGTVPENFTWGVYSLSNEVVLGNPDHERIHYLQEGYSTLKGATIWWEQIVDLTLCEISKFTSELEENSSKAKEVMIPVNNDSTFKDLSWNEWAQNEHWIPSAD